MLFITHDLAVAAEIADRVAVMYAGRIAELGDAAERLPAPQPPVHVGAARLAPRARRPARRRRRQDAPRRAAGPARAAARLPVRAALRLRRAALRRAGAAARALHRPTPAPTPASAPRRSRPSSSRATRPAERSAGAEATAAPTAEPAPASDGLAIELASIVKTFSAREHTQVAVDGVSLEVPAGGALALVGE